MSSGPKLLEKQKVSNGSSKSSNRWEANQLINISIFKSEYFSILCLMLKYFSTKCSSPTIVVSDSKPVPFKPYETTKDVKAKVRKILREK